MIRRIEELPLRVNTPKDIDHKAPRTHHSANDTNNLYSIINVVIIL